MTDPKTYTERVGRYRILRNEEPPAEHKAYLEYKYGERWEDSWGLIWSFDDADAAEKCLTECVADAPKYWTYKLVDNGEASVIERPIW